MIFTGHAKDILSNTAIMEDSSVDCIITSPPYFQQRNYGTEPVIWNGTEKCIHDFREDIIKKVRTKAGPNAQMGNTVKNAAGFVLNQGCFCSKCGAWKGELGNEPTPELYVSHMVQIFRAAKRVLKDGGTVWIVIGDCYNGSGGGHKEHHKNDAGFQGITDPLKGISAKNIKGLKQKDLVGIPFMLAFAMRADGWYWRQNIIWAKGISFCKEYAGSCMAESVEDRFVTSHEYVLMFSKSSRYYFNQEAVWEEAAYDGRHDEVYKGAHKYGLSPKEAKAGIHKGRRRVRWRFNENGVRIRNPRSVWAINPEPSRIKHYAQYPTKLVEVCMLAASPDGGVVLDPFCGSGTTGVVARQLSRRFIGIDINPKFKGMAEERILCTDRPLFINRAATT